MNTMHTSRFRDLFSFKCQDQFECIYDNGDRGLMSTMPMTKTSLIPFPIVMNTTMLTSRFRDFKDLFSSNARQRLEAAKSLIWESVYNFQLDIFNSKIIDCKDI